MGSTAYATNIIALAADKAVVNAALATQASVNTIDDFLDTEVAAILAAVDTEVAAIKTKTDYLPSATAGAAGGLFIAGSNAATSITTALTANITGNLSGSVGSVTGAVGSVTGAVGSVTGAVGSVTGNVGVVATVAANGITATSIATDAINAAAVKADAVTKIQTGLATPTNITAGTITTVTNLTNAATSGDLTATMKTSVTTAATAATPTAAAVTGAVGSVTGNVGGNVVGSVASVANIAPTGTGLTAIPWNAAWDAEVQSEVADALAVYDPPTNAEMEARTLVAADYVVVGDTLAAVTTVGSVTGGVGSVTVCRQRDWRRDPGQWRTWWGSGDDHTVCPIQAEVKKG